MGGKPFICNGKGCYAPAKWDFLSDGKGYCGPCILVTSYNKAVEDGKEAEVMALLNIQPHDFGR